MPEPGQIGAMIGDNVTTYLFGNPVITALFLMAILTYMMLKMRLSLDAALPIYIITLIVVFGQTYSNLSLWIVTIIVAGILYLAISRVMRSG